MNIEEFREYCLSKPGVTEEFPFGPETLVYKVGGKMFSASGVEEFDFVNLKCDPEKAIDLRERYDGIRPGWHMSKKHWNSVFMDGRVPRDLICELIDHSYELVFRSLPKKVREELA